MTQSMGIKGYMQMQMVDSSPVHFIVAEGNCGLCETIECMQHLCIAVFVRIMLAL